MFERHSRLDIICPGDLLLLVHIDLRESDPIRTRELLRQLFVDWRNEFTWSAPVGVNCMRAQMVNGGVDHKGGMENVIVASQCANH